MCKRLVICSGFYRAVQRPSVHVAAERIDRIEPSGVVTADGTLHELDVLVFATGFDTHAYLRPVELTAPGGRTLGQTWSDGPRAYRTVALPGFPNFFMVMGPHSPVGNFSLVPVAETQVDYAIAWIRRWRRGEFAAVAPRADVTEAYNADLRAAMPETVWASGCQSWYLGKDGTPEVWPFSPQRHAAMLRATRADEFEVVARAEGARR
jgi:cation diffusion facilitator CzcD-associated flavoprotein CzcO